MEMFDVGQPTTLNNEQKLLVAGAGGFIPTRTDLLVYLRVRVYLRAMHFDSRDYFANFLRLKVLNF